jgi:hypothetical protein
MASGDPYDQALNGVRLNADGSTVGGNPRGMMVVSPTVVPVPTPRGVNAVEQTPGERGIVLELGHVEKVLKAMPKEKRMELQHVALTRGLDERKVEIATWDRTTVQRISAPPKSAADYPDWREAVKRIAPTADDEGAARVCVNRRELERALKAIGDACPDKGDWAPVWIQFGGRGLLLRGQNYLTQQTAIVIVLPHEKVGGWLQWSTWEKQIWAVVKKLIKLTKGD